ncbi:MAG: MATE family efflux transporter [Eubacteriales bacterium]|nr:MATE family efflux transporter [Eubacteriales bacterium]
MKEKDTFYRTVWKIALPVTLQSLLQSSFSVVDQIMTGQLGSTGIAGIGLAGKFSSVFSVVVSAVAAAAGIMISQYIGRKDMREVSRSFFVNLAAALGLALVFTLLCTGLPGKIMGLYSKEELTREAAAGYLKILSISYVPAAVTSLLSTLLRCMEAAFLPLAAGIAAALVNTCLNYVLIFGKFGFPALGVDGAAIATAVSQMAGCLLTAGMFWRCCRRKNFRLQAAFRMGQEKRRQYLGILLPILACEFLWSLGENVYAAIYGHIGTQPCAAMTLTYPIQTLFIGALSGLSQAAGIMIGKSLGSGENEKAYQNGKKLMLCGLAGSLVLSATLVIARGSYVQIYRVEDTVKELTKQILTGYALIAPVKVQNMILGGGILRSGGRTDYVMYIDFIGTWLFGVPLGLLAAFVLKLSIPWVYLMLSLEECVRLGLSFAVFKKKVWMRRLQA